MQSDLNETDSLLRLWAWILDHTNKLITAGVVALIIGLAIYAFFAFQEGKETQAAHALAEVQPPRTRDSQAPTDLAQRFLKVAEDHKGTRAGTLAT
ncbi:MAG: hypothetical protein FJ405_19380, partial [Verrucomicrobia bacterium]|nr:hypothetical protein [Verrucomicrobiota bacterium]